MQRGHLTSLRVIELRVVGRAPKSVLFSNALACLSGARSPSVSCEDCLKGRRGRGRLPPPGFALKAAVSPGPLPEHPLTCSVGAGAFL